MVPSPTLVGGEVAGTTQINDGTVTNEGTLTGTTTVAAAGTLDTSGTAGVINNAGITDVTGGTTGVFTNTASTSVATNVGVVDSLVNDDGTFTNEVGGEVAGTTQINDGTVTNEGTLTGLTTLTGGALDTSDTAADIVNDGGDVTVSGGTTGTIDNNTGSLTITAGSTGDVTNTGTTTLSGGILASFANNAAGTVNVDGSTTVTGSFTQSSSGLVSIVGGVTLTADTITIDALSGGISIGASAILSGTGNTLNNNATINVLAGGTITDVGAINNNATGIINFANGGTLASDTNNTGGEGIVNAGALNIDGGLVFVNAGTAGGTFVNTGTIGVDAGATLDVTSVAAGLANTTGTLTLDGTLIGDLTNAGTLTTTGAGTITGATVNTGLVDLSDGIAANQSITFAGGLSGAGTFNVDVDLSAGAGGMTQSDMVTVIGGPAVAGSSYTFDVTNVTPGLTGLQTSAIILLDGDNAAPLTFTVNGLPIGGAIIFTGIQSGDDIVIQSSANPAIGGISGGISFVQSLLGTIINRPSSANVSALAYEDEDGCSKGMWGRAITGIANATSHSTVSGFSSTDSLDASYSGLQLGGDFGCFDGRFLGWDMAVGGLLGFNQGETRQDIIQSGVATSHVSTDFTQIYGGVYLAASKNSWTVDLQIRREEADFDLAENALGGAVLGVNGQSFSSSGTTISAAVSYNIYNEALDVSFTPTAGFGYTMTETDILNFNGPESLQTNDHDTKIGFVGLTISKTRVAETGDAAMNYFGTLTAYGDFSDDTTAIFSDGAGGTNIITTEPLGSFGELSLGVSYIKLLTSPQTSGFIRQMNLSARVDARVNSDIESYGITLNARIAF